MISKTLSDIDEHDGSFEKSGRNVTCDNFFTSINLARKLLSKKSAILVNAKDRQPYSTIFGFQEELIILPKKGKVVPLMSTMHSKPDADLGLIQWIKCFAVIV